MTRTWGSAATLLKWSQLPLFACIDMSGQLLAACLAKILYFVKFRTVADAENYYHRMFWRAFNY